jgi:hypothetical protein
MAINGIFISLFNEESINLNRQWHKSFRHTISSAVYDRILSCFNTGMGKERQNCCCTQKPTEWHGISTHVTNDNCLQNSILWKQRRHKDSRVQKFERIQTQTSEEASYFLKRGGFYRLSLTLTFLTFLTSRIANLNFSNYLLTPKIANLNFSNYLLTSKLLTWTFPTILKV